jgi:hypothetical protein
MIENTYLIEYGNIWRRLARLGALLAVVATFLPFFDNEGRHFLWGMCRNVVAWAADPAASWNGLLVFCILCVPAMVSGFFFLLLCTPRLLWSPAYRNVMATAAFMLWVFATATAPCFALKHLPGEEVLGDDTTNTIVGAVIVYLAVHAGLLVKTWQARETPLLVFPLSVGPLFSALAAWLCLLIYTARGYSAHTSALVVFSLGTLGCFLLLMGWLLWWLMVRTAYLDDQWFIQQLQARRLREAQIAEEQAS